MNDLLDANVNINYQDCHSNTAIMTAIKWSQIDVVELLLKRGANPDIQNVFRNTALMLAILYANKEILKLLLKYSINPFVSDNYGKSLFKQHCDDKEMSKLLNYYHILYHCIISKPVVFSLTIRNLQVHRSTNGLLRPVSFELMSFREQEGEIS